MAESELERTDIGEFTLDDLVARVVSAGVVSKVGEARLVTDGLQNVVVILDNELVARFPRNERAKKSLLDEAALLSHLSARVTAPLPVPLYMEEAFSLHRMLHGAVTSRRALSSLQPPVRERLLDDVGQFLNELATATIPTQATSPATTSHHHLLDLRRRAEDLVVPLLWSHQRQWLDELFTAIEAESFANTSSLIHGDLAPYHLLHDPDSGQLTGVLDFGAAGLGDPATDLGCLLAVWGEQFAGHLTRQWPTAVELADRARLVAMTLPLEWAVIALETNATEMAVAHIGHLAMDIAPTGSPFGST